MKKVTRTLMIITAFIPIYAALYGQESNTKPVKEHKNIIRYNLSGGTLFGFNRYIVVGYERVVNAHQSFSVNIGRASLPSLSLISTDSFRLQSDKKSTGFNLSVDYRFYLAKENKYHAPHGVYIGPYYSFNHFERDNNWSYQENGSAEKLASTQIVLNIHTFGAEMGYQFILWKRLALDFVLVGPGLSNYSLTATVSDNLSEENKQQLQNAVKQIITQKFPGMNYVFSDKQFNANGVVRTWSVGYRYIIHIGFVF